MKSLKSINPWLWVPTLYFLEGIPYFLEANPNPGMTAASLLPQMVAEAGIRMEDFLSALIEDK